MLSRARFVGGKRQEEEGETTHFFLLFMRIGWLSPFFFSLLLADDWGREKWALDFICFLPMKRSCNLWGKSSLWGGKSNVRRLW
jgi:hypothetical protein